MGERSRYSEEQVAPEESGSDESSAGNPLLQAALRRRAIQRSVARGGRAGASPERAAAAAQVGVERGGGDLPHREALQRSFGPAHDLSGVSAHVGGDAAEACEAISAEGYTTGDKVAFARTPDVRLAAHEAAHVIQQRAGQTEGGHLEERADAVADRVQEGKSAADLLPSRGAAGKGVQRYADMKAGCDEGWVSQSAPEGVRVSDDGRLALGIGNKKALFADDLLIQQANGVLQGQNSGINMAPGQERIQGQSPKDHAQMDLVKVDVARNDPAGGAGDNMQMPNDCGDTAAMVTGQAPVHPFELQVGKLAEQQEMIEEDTGKRLELDEIEDKLELLHQCLVDRTDPAKAKMRKEIEENLGVLEIEIGELLQAQLARLSPQMLDKLEKNCGFNVHAVADVGQRMAISRGGEDHPGEKTWNFHFAGVVMTSGGDSVTLENLHDEKDPAAENAKWNFEMYGANNGQTFHERWNATKEMGTAPTTVGEGIPPQQGGAGPEEEPES